MSTTSLIPGSTEPLSDERRVALEKLFSRIGEVSSLPTVARRILSLAEDDNSRADDLREAIQSDPVLVARILRRLNSSYYGLSQKVADVRTAVSLLGFREVRNLAMTVFVSRIYEAPGDYGSYKRSNLWSHSVAVAAAGRLISRVCGRGAPEEAYIGGLLHDIGLILIDQTLRRHFHRVIDGLRSDVPTYAIEREILSFDHAMLGGFVAQRWNLPEQVADAITYHHQPWCYEGEHRDLVQVVAVANYLCSRAGWTSLGVHNVPPPPDEVYAGLGLDQVSLAIIWEELEPTLEKAAALAQS
ncbi:metal dependent phosphohydrolase [Pirellula staleyi DSM 6068]|uniref:Metal dependent phosphohydrolase n=1 Tax=Pirellula staleyi (strain ATCC 27377 / DSM 6068 / ICPB 4128) TaxID=530564 RepID=D2QZX5_PIRSD|nr:HDOD domain-containing protein [Pirellula staleyi]ADB18340.1 metal dependent phosphohydrolase [Pirellula staleyi DSM 6068]